MHIWLFKIGSLFKFETPIHWVERNFKNVIGIDLVNVDRSNVGMNLTTFIKNWTKV